MPRVRNGKPEGSSGKPKAGKGRRATASTGRAVAARKKTTTVSRKKKTTPAKAGVESESETASDAETESDAEEKERPYLRLSMIERTRVGRQIMLARHQPKPPSYPALAKQYGLHRQTVKRLYKEAVETERIVKGIPAEETVDDSLALYEALMADVAETIRTTQQENIRLGNVKALSDLIWRKLELMAATRRLPVHTGIEQQVAMLQTFLARFQQLAAKLPTDFAEQFMALSDEVKEEFGYPVIEGRAALVVGEGD